MTSNMPTKTLEREEALALIPDSDIVLPSECWRGHVRGALLRSSFITTDPDDAERRDGNDAPEQLQLSNEDEAASVSHIRIILCVCDERINITVFVSLSQPNEEAADNADRFRKNELRWSPDRHCCFVVTLTTFRTSAWEDKFSKDEADDDPMTEELVWQCVFSRSASSV